MIPSNFNIDPTEINQFTSLAHQWWDKSGSFSELHKINPVRLEYITQAAQLKNKQVADIGCGGGILAESMAKLGAKVTAIDMSEESLNVAIAHQNQQRLEINYILTTAEELALNHPGQFDMVTCLEMLEHVPDPTAIIHACARLLKPGGQLFLSTLNRNFKSYLFAIIGAEYLLNLLPKNTHDYSRFIRPAELATWARQAHLTLKEIKGITYSPFTKQYKLSNNSSINYLAYLTK